MTTFHIPSSELKSLIIKLITASGKPDFSNRLEEEETFYYLIALIIFSHTVIKHIGFKDEVEKRFALITQFLDKERDHVKCNNFVDLDVKPHINIPFCYSDLHEIIIGPGKNQKNIADYISEILLHKASHDFKSPLIKCSTIPWRAK